MSGTIHVVGLGPGSAGLLTAGAAQLLASGIPVIVRTRRHPTVGELDPAGDWVSCDDLYAGAGAFDEVYAAIAGRVMAAAEVGDVVFAVPGHPLFAERSVTEVLALAEARGTAVTITAGVSFADVAATALRQDFATIQLCDALALRIDCQRPALISQVYDRDGAAALKLELLEIYPASHRVTVLRALGTGDEAVQSVELAALDHQPMGYLDAVYVPPLAPEDDVRRFDGLDAIVRRLHGPGGCPWDREQTHESLRRYLLEEAYEALDAIDSGDPSQLAEELGDVLLQVLMHAAVGEREATFGLGDVVEGIAQKLVRRHPHVFGDVDATTADEVAQNWDTLKKAEKTERTSILEGVPASMPALAASQAIQGRARRAGFDWPDIEGPLDKLAEEIGEFARSATPAEREDEFGDILFVVANIAQRAGLDAEQALRGANAKFRRRFGRVEELAREGGLALDQLDLAGLDDLWNIAKKDEQTHLS